VLIKRLLVSLGCTSLLIWQKGVTDKNLPTTYVEHIADGVIKLDLEDIGEGYRRILTIPKMMGTRHSMQKHIFEITEKGIVVQP